MKRTSILIILISLVSCSSIDKKQDTNRFNYLNDRIMFDYYLKEYYSIRHLCYEYINTTSDTGNQLIKYRIIDILSRKNNSIMYCQLEFDRTKPETYTNRTYFIESIKYITDTINKLKLILRGE